MSEISINTIIVPIVISILLFAWLIINTIYLIKKIKETIREANKDAKIVVKCEKCHNEHNATIDDLLSTLMNKEKAVSVSAKIGAVGASVTNYSYFAKKIYCPTCKKKTWSEIKEYNGLALNNTKLMVPHLIKYFIRVFIGGLVIIIFMKLFS